jgi:hypothetical protein
MTEFNLTKTRLQSGIWEGSLDAKGWTDDASPELRATHLEKDCGEVSVSKLADMGDIFAVRIKLNSDILCDGVQTVLVTETTSGDLLDSFSIVSGEPLEADLRAEIDLLRAELDMLKRAFRRHCIETS